MAREIRSFKRVQGIATYSKESIIPDQVYWCRSVDYRTNPQEITLLPKTTKSSGNVITDLPRWAVIDNSYTDNLFILGHTGNIYRYVSGEWSLLHQQAESGGNGLAFYSEDSYLYYASYVSLGRYGPLSINQAIDGTPQTFTDDFLGSAGGVPQNTNSLLLDSASSQYADRADTASLSITGNITLEAAFKLNTLPATGSSMTLISKWDESGATRSYIMDIYGVSGYFGDGSDGALTIAADTTEAPIDSSCTGAADTSSLSATNVSFAAGQIVLIHQTQGTNAGTWERGKILSYTAGTISLETPLTATYTSGAQVRVLKQYTNVTINVNKTYTAKAWNGTVGGIIGWIASGTVTINGTVTANGGDGSQSGTTGNGGGTGGGFRGGGVFRNGGGISYQGEGTSGTGTQSTSANGNGGGGSSQGAGGANLGNVAGSGGGNGTTGTRGSIGDVVYNVAGAAGLQTGTNDLTKITFGGGGSGGSGENVAFQSGGGGGGGGIVFITATTFTMSGAITANGGAGAQDNANNAADGGGGAGGSVLIKAQTATLGTGLITATGGAGGSIQGGAGGSGRIHIDYYTSYTGTTTPTLNVSLDSSLVTTTTYNARIGVSSTGNNSEYLSYPISISTGIWYRLSISWLASSSDAEFYLNGAVIGTRTGTLTAIHNNASRFGIGMNRNGAGTATNFLNGYIDDVRVFNNVQSGSLIYQNYVLQLQGTETGLQAYYKLNNAYTDATVNANDLTASGGPVFSTDVPYPAPTTRLDIDQSADTTGSTYAVPTAISEAATDRLTFTPTKEPYKSIAIKVTTTAAQTVTITLHDAQNRIIALAGPVSVGTGYVEIPLSFYARLTLGRPYHFHVTASGAGIALTTSNLNDLETVGYATYYLFLNYNTDYHPMMQFLNFLAIGNERYLATYDGISYNPVRLTFSSGWKVRCLAIWQEYIAIGCWKQTSISDYSVNLNEDGRIYFWDGISTTFNFFINVPEGSINALLGTKGELHIWAGYQGDHLVYTGGNRARKVKRYPKSTRGTYMEIAPGAVTMWKTLVHYGMAYNTDNAALEHGVYSWGSIDEFYPETLSYDYPISTGTRTGTTIQTLYDQGVRIGMVTSLGTSLFIGWQDGNSFGVDVVDPAGSPFASGTVELLIRDEDFIWKDQMVTAVRGDFKPLASGESVDVKFKGDRATDWTQLPAPVVSGDTSVLNNSVRLEINNGRNREYQLAYDLFATGTTSPTMLGISAIVQLLQEEEAL